DGGSVSGSLDAGASASTAAATDERSEGFEHGLRLGLSVPIGKTGEPNDLRSGDMGGIVGVRVPIWLDVGYRLSNEWWVGLAPVLGLGTVGSDCEDDQQCEWSDLRLSAQA